VGKRRFIQRRDPPYDFIEVTDDYVPPPRTVTDAALWNDRSYDGMRATDGTPINSRTKHREYMKANDLTTADDYKGEWAQARKQRDAYFTGQSGAGAVRREDVARAIAQLERKR
jgi:hypothetical protein